MALSSWFLNKGFYIFILYWAPQIIQLPLLIPLFLRKGREAPGLSKALKNWVGTSFFSLNGSSLEVTLSSVERRGNWHSWMNMRKPRANSGSPHTLRDVRSTPKPGVAFLNWHLRTREKRKILCCSWTSMWWEARAHLHVFMSSWHIQMHVYFAYMSALDMCLGVFRPDKGGL